MILLSLEPSGGAGVLGQSPPSPLHPVLACSRPAAPPRHSASGTRQEGPQAVAVKLAIGRRRWGAGHRPEGAAG